MERDDFIIVTKKDAEVDDGPSYYEMLYTTLKILLWEMVNYSDDPFSFSS